MYEKNDVESGDASQDSLQSERMSEPTVAVEATCEPACEFVWSEDIYAARLAAREFNASLEDNR